MEKNLMAQNGMLVIAGNSIEELEHDLELMKVAISQGATMGCGGSTLEDVEKGLNALSDMVAPQIEEEEEEDLGLTIEQLLMEIEQGAKPKVEEPINIENEILEMLQDILG